MNITNKLSSSILFIALALFCLPGFSAADGTIYQYSIIDSLLVGNYDGELTIGGLKKHGDTGLGTFNRLDGEMVFIDGEVYKITAKGKAEKMEDKARTPFAAAAFLKTDKIIKLDSAKSLKELNNKISSALDSENLFYVIRIDGKFQTMKTRSVPAQTKPYVPLVDVVKKQSIFRFKNIEGSLVGIKSPAYVKGVGVPGYHWHFITRDRTAGGHVLDCVFTDLAAKVGSYNDFFLQLPETKNFLGTEFNQDKEKELKAVEKDSKKK
ncbi:acetolactate decarboxylase [Desulfovibrio sp. JC010]|uniref:acetolactate decarboxylase n=1 Tax=Desulfovibrio sp. JC010 TaxID=2593641 RepID=UPI0013D5CBD1|nr:acetolactate decarboxylase [Desulfovibrio sp. JC010]NDV28400.1 acetolactate decarboxylase [Desulfovibrio sp. JC010]